MKTLQAIHRAYRRFIGLFQQSLERICCSCLLWEYHRKVWHPFYNRGTLEIVSPWEFRLRKLQDLFRKPIPKRKV